MGGNLLRGARSNQDTGEDTGRRNVNEAKCHAVGAYDTSMTINVDLFSAGGNMICHFPVDTELKFPLLAFAHGYGGGGLAINAYNSMLQQLASSGFVACAYTQCWPWCPHRWPDPQLDLIAGAKYLARRIGDDPVEFGGLDLDLLGVDIIDVDLSILPLPINEQSDVGVFGHSSGALSSLMSAYEDTAETYSIGAVMTYDGASINPRLDPDLDDLSPTVPIFMAASTVHKLGIPPQCNSFAKPTSEEIWDVNPNQPLLVACIKGMDHKDNVYDVFRWISPNKAVRYAAAFFGYTLDPTSDCNQDYETTLGEQLEGASSHYINNLF